MIDILTSLNFEYSLTFVVLYVVNILTSGSFTAQQLQPQLAVAKQLPLRAPAPLPHSRGRTPVLPPDNQGLTPAMEPMITNPRYSAGYLVPVQCEIEEEPIYTEIDSQDPVGPDYLELH